MSTELSLLSIAYVGGILRGKGYLLTDDAVRAFLAAEIASPVIMSGYKVTSAKTFNTEQSVETILAKAYDNDVIDLSDTLFNRITGVSAGIAGSITAAVKNPRNFVSALNLPRLNVFGYAFSVSFNPDIANTSIFATADVEGKIETDVIDTGVPAVLTTTYNCSVARLSNVASSIINTSGIMLPHTDVSLFRTTGVDYVSAPVNAQTDRLTYSPSVVYPSSSLAQPGCTLKFSAAIINTNYVGTLYPIFTADDLLTTLYQQYLSQLAMQSK